MPKRKTKRGKRGSKRVGRAPRRIAAKKAPQMRAAIKPIGFEKRKINLVVKNLILFAVLFVLSFVIVSLSVNNVVDKLFWIIGILTGFVAIALLIVLLIFLFARAMKK